MNLYATSAYSAFRPSTPVARTQFGSTVITQLSSPLLEISVYGAKIDPNSADGKAVLKDYFFRTPGNKQKPTITYDRRTNELVAKELGIRVLVKVDTPEQGDELAAQFNTGIAAYGKPRNGKPVIIAKV